MTNHSTRLITEMHFLIPARFCTVERIPRVFRTGNNSELVELLIARSIPQSTSLNRVSASRGIRYLGSSCGRGMGSCIQGLLDMAVPATASPDQTCCGPHTSAALYGTR